MPRDYDDDDTPPPRRPRRRRQSNATAWIVGGILGTIFLVATVVTVVSIARKDRDGPGGDSGRMVKLGNKEFPEEMLIKDVLTMGRERDVPANWTHQDLADHLRSKGIPVTIQHDASLGSANGQGVWFVDARPNVAKRGRIRVYHCPSQRDAARLVVAMRSELYLPYVVGRFAFGIDGNQQPPDEDIFFDMNVKGHLR